MFQLADPFPRLKPIPPFVVREGREAKTQIRGFSPTGTSFFQNRIFHLSHLNSLLDVDKAGIFGAEADVKSVLVVPAVTPKRES